MDGENAFGENLTSLLKSNLNKNIRWNKELPKASEELAAAILSLIPICSAK